MIRFVVIALLAVMTWALLVNIVRKLKGAAIDWTGIATIVGFVARPSICATPLAWVNRRWE